MTDRLPSLSASLAACAALCALLAPQAASAQEWSHAQGEARAVLPAPERASPFTGGALSCEAQVWTLVLATETGEPLAGGDGAATLTVGRESFEAEAKAAAPGVEIVVPHRVIEPLRAMLRVTVAFENVPDGAVFGLAGSRRAITAAEELCSPRFMPSANSVALTPYSSYLGLARRLRRDDIADFTLSTTAEPALRAGMAEFGEGRRLLFSELCGSSWYYGVSGCSLVGFAPAGGDEQSPAGWRPVYESQGVFLYLDPDAAREGWPDLISIPLKEGDEETRWRWNGQRYAVWRGVRIGDVADEIRR